MQKQVKTAVMQNQPEQITLPAEKIFTCKNLKGTVARDFLPLFFFIN
jgi:hypothetical protein